MIRLDHGLLRQAMPHAAEKYVLRYCDFLNDAMEEWCINTPLRVQHFLAQLAQESGELQYARELWGPTKQQLRYERNFSAPWLRGDETNGLAFSLGNSEAGDGMKYMGRGLIQLTGRANYAAFSQALFGDPNVLILYPQKLEEPENACRVAGAFWKIRGCNELADRDDCVAVTKRINGGLTHYDQRMIHLTRIKSVIGG